MPIDQSEFLLQISRDMAALKAENESLRSEVTKLKDQPSQQLDAELLEAISEFDQDTTLGAEQNEAKKELLLLLDDLEGMIVSMNYGIGMNLVIPPKIEEIRNSLKDKSP